MRQGGRQYERRAGKGRAEDPLQAGCRRRGHRGDGQCRSARWDRLSRSVGHRPHTRFGGCRRRKPLQRRHGKLRAFVPAFLPAAGPGNRARPRSGCRGDLFERGERFFGRGGRRHLRRTACTCIIGNAICTAGTHPTQSTRNRDTLPPNGPGTRRRLQPGARWPSHLRT